MDISSLASLGAGLVTSVVEAADPALVSKVNTVASHDVSTFTSHNPGLEPILGDIVTYLEGEANTHGLGVVTSIISGLFPFLAAMPTATVTVPTMPQAAAAPTA